MSIRMISIEGFMIDVQLAHPFRTATLDIQTKRTAVFKLTAASGHSIWTECVALEDPSYMPETLEQAWGSIEQTIAPLVLGQSFNHPMECAQYLDHYLANNRMAKAAIEMGVWGMAASVSNQSLAHYLGATQSTIPAGIALGIDHNFKPMISKIKRALEEGYTKIKIKIKPGYDHEPLQKIREIFGFDVMVAVDANRSYDPDRYKEVVELDNYRLAMIEQPFPSIEDHRLLTSRMSTPICLDESIESVADTEHMIDKQCGSVINIKPGRVGGIAESLAIRDLCRQNNVAVWCGGMLETGIGRAYNVALAACSNFSFPGDISASNRYWRTDIVSPEWVLNKNGHIDVPIHQAGIGVTINESWIREHAIQHMLKTA